MLVCGKREVMAMAPPTMCDSAVSPCFHGYLAFQVAHQAFPTTSLPSHPLDLSFHSQQQPSLWDCSTIPELQLPASAPSRRPMFLPGVCMAVARTVWFSFHLGTHISAVSLSPLNVSPLTQIIAPLRESDPCFSSPPTKGRSSPTDTSVLPPSFFVLPSFAWFYIFFSTGQVLLSALSWCSARTSVSEGVFLMYPWREMYSMSTYFSAILFSLHELFSLWS